MAKPVAIETATLSTSDGSVTGLTYSITNSAPVAADRSTLAGAAILIEKIEVVCSASGTGPAGVYAMTGTGTITAGSPRVTCQDQALVLAGAAVTVDLTGTVTQGGSASNTSGTVRVTVTDAGQERGLADAP